MTVLRTPAIKGIDITTYLVQDVERAKTFYRDVLGMTITMDYGPQGGEFSLGDGSTFGIWKMDDGSFQPSGGVMFAVDDIASAVSYYQSRGVAFEGDSALHESPVCLMAMAKDPDGNSFILHQRKTAAA